MRCSLRENREDGEIPSRSRHCNCESISQETCLVGRFNSSRKECECPSLLFKRNELSNEK
tara:strand:- start:409 stop:588 length:180 start_codon:yes stop_codon:yes gene_type:complete